MNALNHTQARNYLQSAVNHRLKPGEHTALEEHLAACADCRQYAEQIGLLEKNLRTVFHAQWDAASERSLNLLPGIRTRYRRKMARRQLLSLANTLATIGVVVGLLLLLNWFISTRQNGQPTGAQTPTPTVTEPVPPSPTPLMVTTPSTRATDNELTAARPSGSLAFVSSSEELGDIYLIQLGGGRQVKLFDDQLSLSLSPAWAPDGSQLAFVSTRDGNSEIYTVKADGTQPARLTDNPAAETDPAWSPDGKLLAFVSDRSGYRQVYVMDTRGANVTQLTHTQAANAHPTWSPDGTYIAFATNRDGYWQIYRMHADGAEPTNLSQDAAYDDQEPAWSPDGERIAIASQPVNTQVREIFVLNADGSGRTRLTDSSSYTGQSSRNFSPAWSPDSLWIAFCSYRDNPVYGDIYRIPAGNEVIETVSIIRLTTQGASQPAWIP